MEPFITISIESYSQISVVLPILFLKRGSNHSRLQIVCCPITNWRATCVLLHKDRMRFQWIPVWVSDLLWPKYSSVCLRLLFCWFESLLNSLVLMAGAVVDKLLTIYGWYKKVDLKRRNYFSGFQIWSLPNFLGIYRQLHILTSTVTEDWR